MLSFIGTGGVGKTSLSIAAALQAASQGRRVAALTIDPSRRLTSLLGLEPEDEGYKTLKIDSLPGVVDIFHIRPTALFNEFVGSHLSADLTKILEKNGIYQQISQNLRETHNFAALYKMVEISEHKDYDFIVLDTPPCHQVLDFFEAPHRLQKFFSMRESEKSTWLHWIQDTGARVAEGLIRPLVGKEFLVEMDSFFRSITSLRHEVHRVSKKFIELFESPEAKMILVFPPALDKLAEAEFLVEELKKQSYQVQDFVMNRSHPIGLVDAKRDGLLSGSKEEELFSFYQGQQAQSLKMLEKFGKPLDLDKKSFYYIPQIDQKIDSLEAVVEFAKRVGEHWTKL